MLFLNVLGKLRKTTKILIGIVGVPANIRTEHPSNTIVQRSQQFGADRNLAIILFLLVALKL
jgi:hypothetical protein